MRYLELVVEGFGSTRHLTPKQFKLALQSL